MTMQNPFFSPKAVEHPINGVLYNFYPNRVFVVGKLRDFLKPMFKAIATLTNKHDTDIGRESVETKDKDGSYQIRTTLNAIDTQLASQRQAERERLTDKVIEDFTSPPAMRAIGTLVMDSLRDNFSKRPDEKEVQNFLDEVSLDILMQMLKGVALANKEVFGPLGVQIEKALDQFKKRMTPNEVESESAPEQPSEQPEQQLSEIPTTASGDS